MLEQDTHTFLGNYVYDKINSDKLAPPGTDHGQTINAQWPMGECYPHHKDDIY